MKDSRPLIRFPYRGARRSYYIYHPALHGPSYTDGIWEKMADRFHKKLGDFVAVCELYTEQQTLSETVGGPKWKKEVVSLFNAIEKETKNVYELESLCEVIFDTDSKTAQRVLPYHSELKPRADELRFEDSGLSLDGGTVDPKSIIERGWGS